MFPDLSYILNAIFGTSVDNAFSIIQTFGLFLMLAVIAAGYVLYLEFRRYEHQGLLEGILQKEVIGRGPRLRPLIISSIIGFLVGFKLVFIFGNFEMFKADAAGVIISTAGNLWGGTVGLIIFVAWRYYELSRSKLAEPKVIQKIVMPHERVPDITIVAAVSGIIGARLFSVFENFNDFLQDPIGQLFGGSGLTIYGGLILAFMVVYWYVKRLGIKPILMMDAVAPSLIIGYAVGRLGCHLSGDGDWGVVNELSKPAWFFLPDWAWEYAYPHNVINSMTSDPQTGDYFYGGETIPNCGGLVAADGGTPEHCTRLAEAVYPTPLYEAFLSGLIFIVLWVLRKRLKIAGMLFFVYLIFNGLERFLIEGIRVNEHYAILGVTWSMSQFIALGLFVIGVAGLIYLWKYGWRKEAEDEG
ncbi:prolipoprotein diacylglyceryl transferase [Portibacter marinus]|uniref:prolipoprotein diacylglyceryl transferase n=1 Tax=Portibacter marinus TaxID=2898660 RepID=UPI001F32A0ED|nr:prolipoprotein diacylglyceryl transferase family protein [Portibacter marinus]